MGLVDLFRIADLHCQKVESTKWLKDKLRTYGRSGFPFPLRSVMRLLGSSLKLSSSGLVISMTNLIVQKLLLHTKKHYYQPRVCSSTICTIFNVQIGAGRHLTSLSGALRGVYASSVKNKTNLKEHSTSH